MQTQTTSLEPVDGNKVRANRGTTRSASTLPEQGSVKVYLYPLTTWGLIGVIRQIPGKGATQSLGSRIGFRFVGFDGSTGEYHGILAIYHIRHRTVGAIALMSRDDLEIAFARKAKER